MSNKKKIKDEPIPITNRIKKDLVRRVNKLSGESIENYHKNLLRIIIANGCPYSTINNQSEIDLNSIPDSVINELLETVKMSEIDMEYMKKTTDLRKKVREQVDKSYEKKIQRKFKEKEKEKEKKKKKDKK